jgi:hypothetical protein
VRVRDVLLVRGLGLVGAIADGVGEVRRAVREQVRNGANQIKIMAGGRVASPSDPHRRHAVLVEELRAACEEAEAANLYALAHAYSPRAVTRAVQAGVRSIEHGNLIDEATARVMKSHGAYLVPTLSTYAALADEGERTGLVAGDAREAARSCSAAAPRRWRSRAPKGVPVVLRHRPAGPHARPPVRRIHLRLGTVSAGGDAAERHHRAARLMRQEGTIGELIPGAYGPTCWWWTAIRRASCRC